MKKLLLSVLCFLSISLAQAAGFEGSTLVTTSSGKLKPIKELSIGDEIISHDYSFREEVARVKGVAAFLSESTVEVTTQNGINLICSPLERFFVVQEQCWICAKDLEIGHFILDEDLDAIAVSSVEIKNNKQILYFINLDANHNFMASEGRFIVHNGPIGAAAGVAVGTAGTWVAFESAYFGVGAAVGMVAGPWGAYVARTAVKTVCAPVQYATMKTVGLACGIAVGVATGPV